MTSLVSFYFKNPDLKENLIKNFRKYYRLYEFETIKSIFSTYKKLKESN